MKPCKDCLADAAKTSEEGLPSHKFRPAPHPGPRCATHHRAVMKARKKAAHESRVAAVYGLAPGGYDALKELQEGRCAICRRANGATRRLSVDHDHATGGVRGLLCRPCNDLLGRARDSVEFFASAARYLVSPPARRLPSEFFTARETE